MNKLVELRYLFDKLHPYAGTVEQVFNNAGLTVDEQINAMRLIPMECPWFRSVIYSRACHAAGQVITNRSQS